MAEPYDFPRRRTDDSPKFTLMTLIGVIFVAFMAYQIGTTIAQGPDPVSVEDLRAARTVEPGDTVQIDYVARTSGGELYRTTVYSTAQAAESEGYAVGVPTQYEPIDVVAGSQRGPFGGKLAEAVVGVQVGRSTTVTVDAANGTGDWRSITPGEPGIDRVAFKTPYKELRFFQEPEAAAAEGNTGSPGFSIEALEAQIGEVHEGRVYEDDGVFPPALPIVFEDVNRDNRSVLVRYPAEHGTEREVPGLPGPVTLVIEDGMLGWRLDLSEGDTFTVTAGDHFHQVGLDPGSYKIGTVTEDHVEFLHNPSPRPSLVGEDLRIEVRVIEIVQKGAGGDSGGADGSGTPMGPTAGDDGHDHGSHQH